MRSRRQSSVRGHGTLPAADGRPAESQRLRPCVLSSTARGRNRALGVHTKYSERAPPRRTLTDAEQFVLAEVQAYWGNQNTADLVFFTDDDDAALLVKARDGSSPVMVVLTNLAAWHHDGTLSLDQLRQDIRGPEGDRAATQRVLLLTRCPAASGRCGRRLRIRASMRAPVRPRSRPLIR